MEPLAKFRQTCRRLARKFLAIAYFYGNIFVSLHPYLSLFEGDHKLPAPTSTHKIYLILIVLQEALLTFPLIVVTTLFALRQIKISPLPAVVGSLLFAFIPYHFLRGEEMLFLSAYFLLPLAVLVMLWIFEDTFLLNQFTPISVVSLSALSNRKNLFTIIVCIGVGSAFVYYPFFCCFFLLVAGVCAAISRKKWIPLLNSLLLVAVVVMSLFVWSIPTLLYIHDNGRNVETMARGFAESEHGGLKIIQLLLPINGHRIPLFQQIADNYGYGAPLVGENAYASLGIVASVGFVILILWMFNLLFDKGSLVQKETAQRLNQISALNLAAVLLGTIGGFGTILAFLVLPEIRTYCRVSVFIALFSILTISSLVDLLIKTYSSRTAQWTTFGLVITILCLGIYDQTSQRFVPAYGSVKEVFVHDKHFINNIETRFPDDTMVFQLPYFPYPEGGVVGSMDRYDHFRAYLHSKNIHWSYGAIKGRDGALFQSNIEDRPIADMLQALSFAGFNGIYVDSYGYADRGQAAISSISSVLKETPLVSDNGRLYFFDMMPYNLHLKGQYTSEEFERQKNMVFSFLRVGWREGFSTLEGTPGHRFRWCGAQGILEINNPSNVDRRVMISATFTTAYPELSNLKIQSDLFTENLKISNSGYNYEKGVIIPPGSHIVKLSCDAKRINAPDDARYMVFRTRNFQLVEGEMVISKGYVRAAAWREGFSGLEGTAQNNWRWCGAQGILEINNPWNIDRRVIISATFTTGYPELSNLKIESDLITENLKINNSGYNYSKQLTIPPGRHIIKLSCDAKRINAPADPRHLVFSVRNFQMTEIE